MPEQDDDPDEWQWPLPTPTVPDAIDEVRQVLHDVDTTEPQYMDAFFYVRVYQDLDITVRALLEALEAAGVEGNTSEAETAEVGRLYAASGEIPTTLTPADLVVRLRALLGTKLVAYLGETNVRTVLRWADPTDDMKPAGAVAERLRTALEAAALIHQNDSTTVVQAWFQGRNPMLNDISPARFLRSGDLAEVGPMVLAVSREFAAGR